MCVGEQAPKSSKYDFSKIYIQNYKNQKFLGRVRWVRWVRQLVEASIFAILFLQFISKMKNLGGEIFYCYKQILCTLLDF